jgi:hypothetical protein
MKLSKEQIENYRLIINNFLNSLSEDDYLSVDIINSNNEITGNSNKRLVVTAIIGKSVVI